MLGQATCQTNRVDFFVLYTIVSLDVLEILSEFEEHLVKISRKTLGSLILPLTLSLLLFAPPTIQPCQEAEASQSNCCCCQNSCQHVVSSDSKHSQCPCQMEEKQKEESSPGVIVSKHDSKPKPLFLAWEIEVIPEDHFPQLASSYSHNFSVLSRDPPLYLLNSSFLI